MAKDTFHFEQLFDFSDADLQANSEGRLTDHQIEILKRRRRKHIRKWLFASVVGLFILITVFPPVVFPGSNDYFVFGMVLLVFSGAEYSLVATFRAIQTDIRAGVVNTLKGRAHFYSSSGRYGDKFYISVDATVFDLTRQQYEGIHKENLPANQHFQIYYAPKTRILLSIKLIN